jgi:hypothetical protein
VSDNNVIKLAQPGTFTDSLTEILRSGARALLTQAIEAEVAEFLAKHSSLKTETGQQRVVRHGHLPEREMALVQTVRSDRLSWRAEQAEVGNGQAEDCRRAVQGSPLRPRHRHLVRSLVSSL